MIHGCFWRYPEGVKRAAPALFFLVCALAGALAAVVVTAPSGASTGTTSGATTTQPPPTTTAPPATIAPGVTIGGVAVGGLSPEAALTVVRAAVASPLVLVYQNLRLEPQAEPFAIFYVQAAVERARRAAPGTAVRLNVRVRGERVREYVFNLARRVDRRPVDSQLFLRRLRPFITPGRSGRALDRVAATREITRALVRNERFPIRLRARAVPQKITRRNFGPVIVIRRGSNRLYLYRGMRFWRVFGVATGQARYPTPLGRHRIVVKWRNPWWYPPDSEWARGQKPIPPGPGNPLGTRWMGLSVPLVGIHGTPDAASIGYSVSHGCIRMQIPDAEWLFERVHIGTTVFIVRA
jgi:lipoprotein-anchoring transpeptidase ErfK/SrfK